MVGASGVLCWDWDAGKIYTLSVEGATGSRILVTWAVAVGFNYVGIG